MTRAGIFALVPAVALVAAVGLEGCAPGSSADPNALVDPNATVGELVTYVADFKDGHSERWQALRTTDGRELRLDFDTPPTVASGTRVQVRGETLGARLHVTSMDAMPVTTQIGAEPELIAAPATDTFALVLVDLGSGVNKTAAQGETTLFSTVPSDKSFASYYNESSYGKYQVSGDVIGPYPFTMTTCDTTGMYKAIEPMITGTYNHLIYYFNDTSLCDFGGLGEEGSEAKPAKRTWMNGSLTCVVLMQEPGHNLGLMHANTMKCGTDSFSTTPATSCTITEYGSTMSTMGGGCKQFNAYERWYMQWLTGCNGVRVPSSGTFNLLPLESSCPGGVQVLQVPFPATLAVTDPQATTTTVNLKDYYVELRTTGGIFDAVGAAGRGGGGVTFTAPTVFIYASDDVHVPTTTGRGAGTVSNSVWTELLNMTPSGTAFTGLTTAGQSFTDPAGGATITLQSISATGATIVVDYPTGTGSPTCIDGTTLAAPGPTACGATGTGGATGSDGGVAGTGGAMTGAGGSAAGTGGKTGTTGVGGSTTGAGGSTTGTGGSTGGVGGMTTTTGSGGVKGAGIGGSASGAGGSNAAGTGGTAVGKETGTVTGGCACSLEPANAGSSRAWLSLVCVGLVGLLRGRRRAPAGRPRP